MTKIPSFAVVGRTNKGKSSIVATLTENDRIAVAPTPRTTSYAQDFTFAVDGKDLFTVYDTPGFEEAPAILEWLKSVPVAAHQRQDRVREFYRTFQGSGQFRYECELLKPILDGAAILYVADSSHPFRPNFESEFEILQWTGQPSVALLNNIGETNFEEEWKRALGQYFRTVRVFNAHTSWVNDRIALLEELVFLSAETAEPLKLAIDAIRRQVNNRLRDAAHVVANLLQESLTLELKIDADERKTDEDFRKDLLDALRAKEVKARHEIARIFGFHSLQNLAGDELPEGFDHDLFSKETREILGLKKKELYTVGISSGVLAGGSLDAMVGGTSFFAGAGIGGVLGGIGTVYLTKKGINLTRKKMTIGPMKDPNFPWILIDRETTFVQALLRRTHADRGDLRFEKNDGPSTRMSEKEKAWFGMQFQSLRWNVRVQGATESLDLELQKMFLKLVTRTK